jgi:hypothetical protein
MSEYFLAGRKDGGAFIVESERAVGSGLKIFSSSSEKNTYKLHRLLAILGFFHGL